MCNGAPALRLFYAYGRTVVYVVNDVYHFGFWSDVGGFFLYFLGLGSFFLDLYFGCVAQCVGYSNASGTESCTYDGSDGSGKESVVRTLFLWLLKVGIVVVHNKKKFS